jgi:hypothetical protein
MRTPVNLASLLLFPKCKCRYNRQLWMRIAPAIRWVQFTRLQYEVGTNKGVT